MTPVFIGGCPRSGTTLLGAILGAHPESVCIPESGFKTEVLRFNGPNTDSNQLLRAIFQMERFRLWGLDVTGLQRECDALRCSYPEAFQWLVRRYADTVGRTAARIWVDHTPRNVRVGVTLLDMFPDAKFVHIVRDGRAVATSILPLDWGPNTILAAAHWWAESLAYGLALESWGGSRVIRVRYEDVVADPGPTVQALARFAGIDYRPEMLHADGFQVPYPTRQHRLVGSPPQSDRAHSWTKTLKPREIEIFESVAGDLLRYLGYDLWFGPQALPASKAERLLLAVRGTCQEWLVNRLRARLRLNRYLHFLEANPRKREQNQPSVKRNILD